MSVKLKLIHKAMEMVAEQAQAIAKGRMKEWREVTGESLQELRDTAVGRRFGIARAIEVRRSPDADWELRLQFEKSRTKLEVSV